MSNQLTPFNFEGSEFRVIKDENNGTWFLAKDICAILGYTNVSQTISDNCVAKGISKRYTPTSGGNQELIYINEGNFYRLVVKSNKPEAERFESWVCDEVLVEIRKTGSYSVQPAPNTKAEKPSLVLISKETKAGLALAKLFGLSGNQAYLHADEAVQKTIGQLPIKLLGIELTSPNQERHFNVTTLAEIAGFKSAIALNKELEAQGFQVKVGKAWTPTEKGKPFAVLLDKNKAHAHGTVQQLEWRESIKHELSKTNAGGTAHA